jgi:putative phosphoesterase
LPPAVVNICLVNAPPINTQTLRRIGVIGDIHCEDRRLAAALEFLQAQSLDLICAVGDIIDGPGDPNRTITLLEQHRVVAVRGNHERWMVRNEMRGLPNAQSRFDFDALAWAFLNQLPLTRRFETVAGSMLLCHGLGDDDMAGVSPFDNTLMLHANIALWRLVNAGEYAFVINGHTHQRMVWTFGNLTIINAGTLYRKHHPCFCLVNFVQSFVQFFNVDAEGGITEAERFELPVKIDPDALRPRYL